MVNHAKSERVKRHVRSRNQEHKITQALAKWQQEQEKPSRLGRPKSIETIAREHGVSYGTLHRRTKGGKSRSEASEKKQRLTAAQEWSLVQFICESADMGLPLSHRQIEEYVNGVRQAIHGTDCDLVGKQWVFAFLDRHHDNLQTHWSKSLDSQRAKSLNPTAVKSWVDLVKKHIVDMRVEPDCIYGMDESGFPTGYTGKERVVGTRGTKTQHKQGGASRQNITTLVTIRGDGKMVVPPMVIFPGANFQSSWNKGNTINAFISRSLSGWTDHDLGYEWLSKVFEPSTGANGRTRVLLLDGHSSHYSEKFLAFAREHKIVLLGYPPHCTHRLQGLDVVCFSKMKECWKRGIVDFEARNKCDVAKADFMTVWAPAYKEAFDEETVRAAFRVTGIVPFNPDFVTAEDMAPSQASSTRGEFPMPQPSPVRRITQAMALHPPTRLEQSAGLLDPPSPCTPARCLGDDDNHNKNGSPTLWTPSKKMRSLYAHLGASSSGSLLLSTPKITSRTNPISEPVIESMPRSLLAPDWSLAGPSLGDSSWKSRGQLEAEGEELRTHLKRAEMRERIHEQMLQSAHATMILQNMTLKKTNQALHLREERATNERARLFKGQAQCLSSDDFFNEVQALNTEKENKNAEREKRKAMRKDKRTAKAALEEEWAGIKKDHAAKVAAWEQKCTDLKQTGFKKKDLPPKPKCPPKPRLPEDGDDDEDEDDEQDQADEA
ncbi:unnamed protein product [Mycena citricolor]|uniref:HTH CENPB-type domain-containing protein n=1 Tax=Mycena citricolor TaxID=2018698 RepID=A0AAD2K396_9AGAR|nr:unnamed protein product [Mycena citricolor]